LHRDIKCENAMLLRWGKSLRDRVRLIDFGIVRDDAAPALTPGEEVIGTLSYLAPEMVGGKGASVQCDLYALGIVLYAMCTGTLPFSKMEATRVVRAILEGVPRADVVRPELTSALVEVIARATTKDPAARFQSAQEFREALDGLGLQPGEIPGMVTRTVRAAGDPTM